MYCFSHIFKDIYLLKVIFAPLVKILYLNHENNLHLMLLHLMLLYLRAYIIAQSNETGFFKILLSLPALQRRITPTTLQSSNAAMFWNGCLCQPQSTRTPSGRVSWFQPSWSQPSFLPPSISFSIHPYENINELLPLLTTWKKRKKISVFNVSKLNKGWVVFLILITAWYYHDD